MHIVIAPTHVDLIVHLGRQTIYFFMYMLCWLCKFTICFSHKNIRNAFWQIKPLDLIWICTFENKRKPNKKNLFFSHKLRPHRLHFLPSIIDHDFPRARARIINPYGVREKRKEQSHFVEEEEKMLKSYRKMTPKPRGDPGRNAKTTIHSYGFKKPHREKVEKKKKKKSCKRLNFCAGS